MISLIAVIAISAVSVPQVRAAYSSSCSPNGIWKNWTTIDRLNTTQNITGALADVDLRSLAPCTENSGVADQSFVAISLQYNGTDSSRIVQIGYSRCGDVNGCNGIPSDGKMHFWSTHSDTGAGLVYLADGWYRAPVLGHRYRMKVQATTHNGGSVWQYCIEDLNVGDGYACHFENRTWTDGLWAWWGTETGNTGTQNGTKSSDLDINLVGQYVKGGIWYTRSGTDNVCSKSSEATYPSYYGCAVRSDLETLWSWTVDH